MIPFFIEQSIAFKLIPNFMEFCAVVMILCPFKPMHSLEYRDMDTGNTGDIMRPIYRQEPSRTDMNRQEPTRSFFYNKLLIKYT